MHTFGPSKNFNIVEARRVKCNTLQYHKLQWSAVQKNYSKVQYSKHYLKFYISNLHCIIRNNGILKSNSSIFPWSEGYITQYTPEGVYGLIVNKKNEESIYLMIV